MLNDVTLIGNVTKEITLRTTTNGKNYCYVTVAINGIPNKDGEKQTDFIDVILWNQSAVFASKYCHKGDGVQIKARLKNKPDGEVDGKPRTVLQVVGSDIQIVHSRNGFGNNANNAEPSVDEAEEFDLEAEDMLY